jgi:chromosome segregation ATPase
VMDWIKGERDWEGVARKKDAEIARLRAELAEANRERDAMRAVVAGLRADVSELHADVIEVNDEAMEVAASLDAEEIARLQERISELYRGQKNQILSAKSVEYDIGTLQEEIARLREAAEWFISASDSRLPTPLQDGQHPAWIRMGVDGLRRALVSRPPEGKGGA